jgi:hypothetical protein
MSTTAQPISHGEMTPGNRATTDHRSNLCPMENQRRDSRKLILLVELCRELAKLGIGVGLSDARPALSVRNGPAARKVWITVDDSCASFVWRRDDHAHHAVDDPAGAAARIAAYLKKRDDDPGTRP